MRDAIELTRVLRQIGWRVELTEAGPTLRKATDAAPLSDAVRKQLTRCRLDLIDLHQPTCRKCNADVCDGVSLAEANGCGPGAGCPFAGCSYRG